MASAASAQPGATGTAGSTPAAGAAAKKTYTLAVKPTTEDLKAHMNHKIEVTGMIAPASGAGASGATSGAGAGATSGAGAAAAAGQQTLNVESFKMVSATCP
jgi:hypothetical protein